MNKKIKYTNEILNFIYKNYEGKDNIELANLVNKEFGINTNKDSICNLKARLKRRKGINLTTNINRGRYRKGISPTNKGKKWDEYLTKEQQEKARKTTFKKGNKPHNAAKIGTERKQYINGKFEYWYVKICDGKGNKNWIPKHRLIYEKENGLIPDNCKVIFADGNRENFDIDNLVLVSNAEELILNSKNLLSKDKEITKTGVLIAKVIDKTNKMKNERL